MDVAIFSKSAKGLMLASGLIVGSTILGYAQDATVPLGSQATVALNSLYSSAPTGTTTLGGHSFDLTGGNLVQLNLGQSASFTGSWTNPKAAYLLLNTCNTLLLWDGTQAGTVTITYSDGTTQATNLTVGANIREWRIGAAGTDITLTDPATKQVWAGSAYDGSAATIDMLTITLPGTKSVTGVSLHNAMPYGSLCIQLAGLTVDNNVVAPPTTGGGSGGTSTGGSHGKGHKHPQHQPAKHKTPNDSDKHQRHDPSDREQGN